MILVDTSIWIDHLHDSEPTLQQALASALVCTHPLIVGELAMGQLQDRQLVLSLLTDLVNLPTATHTEVLTMIDAHGLYGRGLSLVDAHLLAALLLAPTTRLWTRDRRLRRAGEGLGIATVTE